MRELLIILQWKYMYTWTLKMKTRYYLEILMLETMKFLGSAKSKKTKDETGENIASFRNYWSSIRTLEYC